jgi:hypothetical protein
MSTPRKRVGALTRRDFILLFGVVALGLIVVVSPVLYLGWSCSEAIRPVPSPSGEYVALDVARGCGGAAGSVTSSVRVRSADEPDAAGETVLSSGIGLPMTLTWLDDHNLVIDYTVHPERAQYVGAVKRPNSDINVIARPRAP